MPTSNFRRSVFPLVLVALLGAPLTSAAAAQERVGVSSLRQISWESATTWLWRLLGRVTKEGCRIAPSGRCVTDSLESTDNGCLIDPSGRCIADPDEATKNGCRIDPDGRCIPE